MCGDTSTCAALIWPIVHLKALSSVYVVFVWLPQQFTEARVTAKSPSLFIRSCRCGK